MSNQYDDPPEIGKPDAWGDGVALNGGVKLPPEWFTRSNPDPGSVRTRELMERIAASVFNYGFDPAKHGDDHTAQLVAHEQLVCVTLEDDDCTTPALGYLKIVQDAQIEERNRAWYAQYQDTFDVKRPEKPRYRWRYPVARNTACAPGHWQLWSLPQDVPRSHQWPAVVVPARHPKQTPSRAEYEATRRNAWRESDGFARPLGD